MGRELHERLEAISGSFSKTKQEVIGSVETRKYPLVSEPALIHPLNSSTVKIRENGSIDIFVGTDNGIRINPNERSISMLSNTYGQKSTNYRQTVTRDQSSDIGGNWTVKVKGNVGITADGKMSLDAGKGVYVEGRTIREWLDTIRQT